MKSTNKIKKKTFIKIYIFTVWFCHCHITIRTSLKIDDESAITPSEEMKRSQLKQYQIVPMVKKAIQFSAV
jgi:hypothetical protein